MRLTNHQYAAIRNRMRTRALEQEVESQTRAARRLGSASTFGFEDEDSPREDHDEESFTETVIVIMTPEAA